MLSVCDGVTNDVLQKDLQNTTGLLVDEARDTLDTTTTSKTTNGLAGRTMSCLMHIPEQRTYGLGDTLDVVTQNLTVTLSTALSETLRKQIVRRNVHPHPCT